MLPCRIDFSENSAEVWIRKKKSEKKKTTRFQGRVKQLCGFPFDNFSFAINSPVIMFKVNNITRLDL